MQTVKGAQRQVVVMRIGESRYFEEAFFVVRLGVARTRTNESEMLLEANRILRECTRGEEKRGHPRLRRALWFLLGLAVGAGVAWLVAFLRSAT